MYECNACVVFDTPHLLCSPCTTCFACLQVLPAMVVTYRLAGVDGEATEEVVDNLSDSDASTDQDPELRFGIARDIAEVCMCVCLCVHMNRFEPQPYPLKYAVIDPIRGPLDRRIDERTNGMHSDSSKNQVRYN